MSLNIAAGAMGSMWFIVCSPQPIYNVFLRNALGISSSRLGLLLSVTQFMAAFQLVSILIFGALRRRKPFVIGAHLVQRAFAFVLAGVAFWADAAHPARPDAAFPLILGSMTLAWVAWNACSSGWWAWVADIFPDTIRGSFFGRRSAIINAVNILWFFLVSLALDWAPEGRAFAVYGAAFAVAGTVGILDMVLHLFIPEPLPEKRERLSAADFIAPLRDRNYLSFMLAVGLALFSINVFAPFVGPYTTSPVGIGAPNTWLGISYALSQLAWIAAAPMMGLMMDRYGRKPVVVLGLLSTLNWIGYLFADGRNYVFLLPAMSLFSGFLASGFWEGQNQMMLSLTPERNRTAYVSWYLALTGMIASAGPYAGGLLYDILEGASLRIVPGLEMGPFQIVMLASLGLCFLSMLALSRIREGRERPLGYLLSRLANPEFFRTVLNLNIISGSPESARILRALRLMDGPVSDIALTEVRSRLADPDMEVRIEAVRALGRIKGADSAPDLIGLLEEPSLLRCEAALALGKLGDPRALPHLVKGLSGDSPELQDACARSIGLICQACAGGSTDGAGAPESRLLLDLFLRSPSEALSASAAEALSRLGDVDAAVDIYPRYRTSADPRVRAQFAMALANLLGGPGEFYQYLSGSQGKKNARLQRLYQEASRRSLALAIRLPSADRALVEAALAEIGTSLEGEGEILAPLSRAGQALLHALPAPESIDDPIERGRLALARWFFEELERASASMEAGPELRELDASLGLFALARLSP